MLVFPLRCLRRFLLIDGKTRAVALAGQVFIAIIPLLLLVASIGSSTGETRLGDGMVERFHLSGTAATSVRTLFSYPPGTVGAFSVFEVVVLLLSLTSMSRTLQATYEDAWGLTPHRGLSAALRGLSGSGLLIAQLILLALIVSGLEHLLHNPVLPFVVRLVVSFLSWWVLQHLLLTGRVSWRALVPAALVATVGQLLCSAASSVYMPHIISVDASRYGIIGVTLALLSWLIFVSLAVVIGIVAGAELAAPGGEARGGATGRHRAGGGQSPRAGDEPAA